MLKMNEKKSRIREEENRAAILELLESECFPFLFLSTKLTKENLKQHLLYVKYVF